MCSILSIEKISYSQLSSCQNVKLSINKEGGVRVCGDAVLLDFWCGFAVIFILSCGIAVLQNQAVCSIQKFSGNFNVVSGFLMLFCAVFTRISVRFCGIGTPLMPPSTQNCIPHNCYDGSLKGKSAWRRKIYINYVCTHMEEVPEKMLHYCWSTSFIMVNFQYIILYL